MSQAMQDLRAGRSDAALRGLRGLVQRRPGDHDAAQALALVLIQTGQHEEGLQVLQRTVAAQPRAVGYRNNFANALLQHKRVAEAAVQWEQVVATEPTYVMGWLGLAAAKLELRDAQGAIHAAEQGLRLRPGGPHLVRQLVMALQAADRLDDALALAARALQADPQQHALRSLWLLLLNYSAAPAEEIAEQHRAFGRLHAGTPKPVRSEALAGRALLIGILSADLRTHSVAFFVASMLHHVPPWATMTVFSLAATHNDVMTQRLRALAAGWHEVGAMDDAALDQAIRSQRIDVLLDLHGHTGGNRLLALAGKPAPVIVTAVGYPNTTGHPAVDWRLVDSITDPPGAEHLSSERLLRLDPCFLCYAPPADAPLPGVPAAGSRITFGSFNTLSKINAQTIALWARVLDAVPGALLMLKTQALADPAARSHLSERLARGGIGPERVEFVPATATIAEHLALYARLHVALDTVPYNGTTTTCEALWMGVPVLCLQGDRHAGRVGASLLSAIGRTDLLASSPDDFVHIAQRVAAAQPSLQSRLAMRETLRSSALMDGAGYAERFFAALRGAFEDWRTQQPGGLTDNPASP